MTIKLSSIRFPLPTFTSTFSGRAINATRRWVNPKCLSHTKGVAGNTACFDYGPTTNAGTYAQLSFGYQECCKSFKYEWKTCSKHYRLNKYNTVTRPPADSSACKSRLDPYLTAADMEQVVHTCGMPGYSARQCVKGCMRQTRVHILATTGGTWRNVDEPPHNS